MLCMLCLWHEAEETRGSGRQLLHTIGETETPITTTTTTTILKLITTMFITFAKST